MPHNETDKSASNALLGIHAGSRASCDKAASIHELAQLAVAHVTPATEAQRSFSCGNLIA